MSRGTGRTFSPRRIRAVSAVRAWERHRKTWDRGRSRAFSVQRILAMQASGRTVRPYRLEHRLPERRHLGWRGGKDPHFAFIGWVAFAQSYGCAPLIGTLDELSALVDVSKRRLQYVIDELVEGGWIERRTHYAPFTDHQGKPRHTQLTNTYVLGVRLADLSRAISQGGRFCDPSGSPSEKKVEKESAEGGQVVHSGHRDPRQIYARLWRDVAALRERLTRARDAACAAPPTTTRGGSALVPVDLLRLQAIEARTRGDFAESARLLAQLKEQERPWR